MRNQNQMKRKPHIPSRQLFMLLGMAIILIAAVMVLTVSIGSDRAAQYAEAQDALTAKEQAQLTEIRESLKGIDKIVTTSREQLSEASLTSTDTEKTLAGFSESLAYLEKHLATVETGLKSFSEVSTSENTTVNTAMAALFNRQEEIREQLAAAAVTITDILSDMESSRDAKFSETFSQLYSLKDTASDIQKKAVAYHKDLVNTIGLFQGESQAAHKELTETLKNDAEALHGLLTGQFTDLQNLLNEDYHSLIQQMGSLHGQIGNAEISITGLLSLMEKQAGNRQSEIREAFAAVVTALEQITTDFNAAHADIKTLITALSEKGTAHHEEALAALAQTESNMAAGANQNFSRIVTTLQDLQQQLDSQILNLQGDMARQFGAMQESGAMNHEETVSVIKDLSGSMAESADRNLSEITGFLQDMESEFASLVNEIQSNATQNFAKQQEGENARHEETIAALADTQKNMAETAGRNLASVSHFLTAMQADFGTLISKIQNDVKKNFDRIRETETAITGNAGRNLAQAQKSLQEVQDSFNSLITSLKSEVAQGFDDLSGIDAALADIENSITGQSGKNLAETKKSLQSMQDRIDSLFSGIQSNMAQGFGVLQGIATAYHSDTISTISDLESSLIENASRNHADISGSITAMKNQINNSLDTVQNNVNDRFSNSSAELIDRLTQLTTDLTGQLDQMDSRISNQYSQLNTTINNNNAGQQENHDALLDAIKKELQTVFQLVSSGKSRLASALLTKSITIKADATFQEIQQAILDIPQQLIIGVDHLPGEISYDYHYHTGSLAGGGCYTKPVYHAHTAASGNCYKTVNSYCGCSNNHTVTVYACFRCGNTSPHSHDGTDAFNDGYADPVVGTRCGSCGHSEHSGRSCGHVTGSRRVLNCTKGGTVESYALGCGLNDGQIIGAHIVYAKTASPMRAAVAEILANQNTARSAESPDDTGTADSVGTPATPDTNAADPTETSADTGTSDSTEIPDNTDSTDSTETPAGTDTATPTETPVVTDTSDIPEAPANSEPSDTADTTGSKESQDKTGIPGQDDTEGNGIFPSISGNTLIPGEPLPSGR